MGADTSTPTAIVAPDTAPSTGPASAAPAAGTYTVQQGDTASGIAAAHGMTAQQFLALNPSAAASGAANDYQGLTGAIKPGQTFSIGSATPAAPGAVTTASTGTHTGSNVDNTQTGSPMDTKTPVGVAYQLPGVQTNPDLQYQTNAGNGTSNVDEAGIRAATNAQFQDEINQTNSTYAAELAKAIQAGAGNVGTATAEEARNGTLGSDFGNAQTGKVNNDTNTAETTIGTNRQNAIDAITAKSEAAATAAIAAQNKAIGDGLDARLKYYQSADTRAAANATSAANFILNQGIDVKDLTPEQLQTTAANYGVTPEAITNAFATAQAAAAKAAKAGDVSVASGSTLFALQPDGTLKAVASGPTADTTKLGTGQILYSKNADGTYTQVASGPAKTTAAGASEKPLVSNGKSIPQTQIGSIRSAMETAKGSDGFMDPYQYAAEYQDWVGTYGLNGADFVKEFPPKDFVNPSATNLPSYLMPGKSSKSTSTSGATTDTSNAIPVVNPFQ